MQELLKDLSNLGIQEERVLLKILGKVREGDEVLISQFKFPLLDEYTRITKKDVVMSMLMGDYESHLESVVSSLSKRKIYESRDVIQIATHSTIAYMSSLQVKTLSIHEFFFNSIMTQSRFYTSISLYIDGKTTLYNLETSSESDLEGKTHFFQPRSYRGDPI